MPPTASKRVRASRSATRKRTTPSATSRFDDLLRDQSLLLRWLLVILAVLVLAVIVEAWHAPFPYRLAGYTSDGIAARIEFRRENEYSTDRARDEAAEAVSPIFRMDVAPLKPLPAQLRIDLETIAQAQTRADVPDETLAAFGLGAPEPGRDAASLEQEFQALQKAARVTVEGEGNPVDTLVSSFSQILTVVRERGLVTVEELNRNEVRTDGIIKIIRPGDGAEFVSTEDVLLSEATSKNGYITQLLNKDPSLKPIAPSLRRWFARKAIVTLKYDDALTKEARRNARDAVETIYNTYNYRDILVPPDSRIEGEAIQLLVTEHAKVEAVTSFGHRIARGGLVLLMIIVLAALNACYLYRNERRLFNSSIRLAIYLAAILIGVALGRYLSHDPWRAEIVPLITIVMIMAIAYDQLLATLTAFTLSALIVLSTTGNLGHFVVLMAVSAAAILPLSSVDSRIKLIKIGFVAAIVYFIVSIGLGVLERQSLSDVWNDDSLLKLSILGAAWCLVASYFVAGNLPFIENAFGIVTDISLLEMTDVSHPLLQELVRRAPGTYNHSMAVASIGETAADAIGANGLLVRVGAYFHDVGKMLKPHYFVENMSDGQRSRHEQLAPAMSTLIIIGHVKDGADLAREQNLPRRLIDFIEQHHGTTLVEYFYREATRLADQSPDHKTDAEESAFRYPGPKPQSKEAAVMMLADAVESASRTLSEIRVVEESLIKSLIGIYHGRIKYPDQPQ